MAVRLQRILEQYGVRVLKVKDKVGELNCYQSGYVKPAQHEGQNVSKEQGWLAPRPLNEHASPFHVRT
jgi:hypothetical protein